MQFLIDLAFKFWPSLYKKRFFKKINTLQSSNYQCEPELLLLNKFLNSDSTFIDIGTNKGIYLYQAEKIIRNGKIYGFEPNLKMVKFCNHLFPKINIFPLAVSNKTGVSTLYIPLSGTKEVDTRASLENLGTNTEKVEIETITLDDWASKEKVGQINLIKIDVEGHEWDTIQGCSKVVEKFKPVFIIEIEKRHANYAINQIFDWFLNKEYSIYYFNRESRELQPFNFVEIDNFQKDEYLNDFNLYINNFIFIPKK